ncbi:MAG: hypothetical protein IPJ49_07325 [Candidatus Obscuribacter sp.]|nr:hypothetical protein [Candidatus Obscuribacter sp.]
MKTRSYKFKRFAAGSICLVSIACGMLLTSCSTPTRTPKILDYATRTASEVQIKLADGNGLTMDLTEPNVLYNGVVSVQLKGKKFPPVLCDPEAAQHFDEDIQRDGFFVRYRWGQPVSRDFTSVALSEDMVFISGGNYGLDGVGERVEAPTYRTYVYNRVDEELIPGPPMLPPRRGHFMVLLKDKRVLIVGGTTLGGKPVIEVQTYDPVKKIIEDCGHLSRPRTDFLLLPLADGRVLVVGGRGLDDEEAPDKLLSSIEIIDPAKKKISVVGQLHEARLNPRGFAFGQNSAIIYGGIGLAPKEGESPTPSTTVEIYGAD